LSAVNFFAGGMKLGGGGENKKNNDDAELELK
jgi:hypothetical protein